MTKQKGNKTMSEKTEPRVLQGTMELLPPDQILFNRMYDTIRAAYESFGFLPPFLDDSLRNQKGRSLLCTGQEGIFL